MKPYPKYKDSGVEWIGDVPEGWEVKKLKYSDKVIMGQSPSSDNYNDLNVGFPFLQGNADFTSLYPNPRIWCETAKKYAKKNDVLLSVRAPIGAVNIADQKYGIGRGLCAIRSMQSLPVLLFYFALSLNSELKRIGTGSTYTAISVVDAENMFISDIPHAEQKSIATYLNRKTTQIDNLISKKQKLIELLKEERAAIINQAVTKGLNPDAPMKDSGIEWLGEVPEHWDIKRLKYMIRVRSGDGITNEAMNQDGKYEVYGGNGFIGYSDKFNVKSNSIIIGRVGAKCGNVRYLKGEKWISDNALILKSDQDYTYLKYLLESLNLNHLANQNAQPLITSSMVKLVVVTLPNSLEEQKLIANFIKAKTKAIDQTTSKIEKQINLLQEYRTALISEVVTGKIDVRT